MVLITLVFCYLCIWDGEHLFHELPPSTFQICYSSNARFTAEFQNTQSNRSQCNKTMTVIRQKYREEVCGQQTQKSMFISQKDGYLCSSITQTPCCSVPKLPSQKETHLLQPVYIKDSSRHKKSNQFSLIGSIK